MRSAISEPPPIPFPFPAPALPTFEDPLRAARAAALRTLHRIADSIDNPLDNTSIHDLREARLASIAILRLPFGDEPVDTARKPASPRLHRTPPAAGRAARSDSHAPPAPCAPDPSAPSRKAPPRTGDPPVSPQHSATGPDPAPAPIPFKSGSVTTSLAAAPATPGSQAPPEAKSSPGAVASEKEPRAA